MPNATDSSRRETQPRPLPEGLQDILVGTAMTLYFVGLWWMWQHPESDVVGLALLSLPIWFILGEAVRRRLRGRFTWARRETGPARSAAARRLMIAGVAVGAVALVLILAAIDSRNPDHTALVCGVWAFAFPLASGAAAWYYRRSRYALYALVAFVVGGGSLVWMDRFSPALRGAAEHGIPVEVALGVTMIGAGAWSLLRQKG